MLESILLLKLCLTPPKPEPELVLTKPAEIILVKDKIPLYLRLESSEDAHINTHLIIRF